MKISNYVHLSTASLGPLVRAIHSDSCGYHSDHDHSGVDLE